MAANKWDLLDEKDTNTAERGRKMVGDRVPFFKHVPFVFTSALTGQRARKILDLIVEVAESRRRRIETADVNRVLEGLLQRAQPPQAVGKAVKLFYASQIASAPPTIAVVTNRPEAIPESYQRYLVNGFYKAWEFTGTKIRLKLKARRDRH